MALHRYVEDTVGFFAMSTSRVGTRGSVVSLVEGDRKGEAEAAVRAAGNEHDLL